MLVLQRGFHFLWHSGWRREALRDLDSEKKEPETQAAAAPVPARVGLWGDQTIATWPFKSSEHPLWSSSPHTSVPALPVDPTVLRWLLFSPKSWASCTLYWRESKPGLGGRGFLGQKAHSRDYTE